MANQLQVSFVDPWSREPADFAEGAVLLGLWVLLEPELLEVVPNHAVRRGHTFSLLSRSLSRSDSLQGSLLETIARGDHPDFSGTCVDRRKACLADYRTPLAHNSLRLRGEGLCTAELRLYDATLEPEPIREMWDLGTKLVRAVRGKDARLLQLIDRRRLSLHNVAHELQMKIADRIP